MVCDLSCSANVRDMKLQIAFSRSAKRKKNVMEPEKRSWIAKILYKHKYISYNKVKNKIKK